MTKLISEENLFYLRAAANEWLMSTPEDMNAVMVRKALIATNPIEETATPGQSISPNYPSSQSVPTVEPIPLDEEHQSGPDAWEGGFAPNH